MKFAASFFAVLVVFISGMLFFQYQVYSDKHSTGKGDFFYTQEVDIEYRDGNLDIRQKFKNLPSQTIDLYWPSLAINADCFIDSETSCERLNEDFTKFNDSDIHSQSISYIIPLEGGLQSNQLLKDIFVTLQNGNVTHSTVHISTDQTISGQWVTGLPLVGQQSLTLVNYTMFSGAGPINELFWQESNLSLQHASNQVSIFSSTELSTEIEEVLNEISFFNENHLSIVHGGNTSGLQGKRILFLDDLSIKSLNEYVVLSQVRNMYDFGNSPQWVIEAVAMFLTDLSYGDSKANEIKETLTSRMTNEQLQKWKQQLIDLKGKKVTTVELDEALSAVMNNHTEYFTLNVTSEGEFPFLFNDQREIYVNNDITKNVDIIFKGGQVFYSANTLLDELGYQVEQGPNGYYANNEVRSFRFPENHLFYVYNERRYNTISHPIMQIAGTYFIEESWLKRLFLVDIKKSQTTVTISATTAQQ